MFSLTGKTALITGSSRGIGKELLLELARNGAKTILHCRRPCSQAEAVLEEARACGAECYAVYADLAEKDGAQKVCEQIHALGLEIDILILNASVELRRSWTGITDEEYDLQMNINLRAPIKLMQSLIPPMMDRNWGRVITVGSLQQRRPHPDMLVYAASKSALANIAVSLAGQTAPYGVTVNNIAPGAIRTDRNVDALSDPEYEEKVRRMIPVQYIGCPTDVASLVVYLASEESKYMTGQDIYIDGGKGL